MKTDRTAWIQAVLNSLQGIAVTSFIFAGVMSVLVIAAFLQLKMNDPLASPAITALYERLRDDPGDEELKTEIRTVDLLARRAYFTNREQVTRGGILILAGAAAGIIALGGRELLRKKTPVSPKGRPVPEPARGRLLSRVVLAVGGPAIFIFSLITAFLILPMEMENGTIPAGEESGLLPQTASYFQEDPKNAWPGFRGPNGLALAENGNWPLHWDGKSGEGILWKKPLGLPGTNSPVVVGEKVFLSGAEKTGAEIMGIDVATGEMLFTTRIDFRPGTAFLKIDVQNVGYAAATMAADEKHLAALFAGGELVCLDHLGKVLWQQYLGAPDLNYGFSSSPLLAGGTLFIQYDHNGGARIMALDPASGEIRWEKKRDVYSSWASPVMGTVRGRPAVILSANPYTTAYDAESGEEFWSVDLLTGEIGASPTYAEGLVLVGNDPGLMAGLKADDGTVLWEYYDDIPSVASPVVHGGLLFMASSSGAVTCLDVKTGERVWRQDFTDGFYASPVVAGGNVYLTDREGVTHIVAAAREYALLAASALGEPADATPAFTGGKIFIRGGRNLYCVGE